MSSRRSIITLLVILFSSHPASSQDFERILLPVVTAPAPGGYGSIWQSFLTVHNGSDEPATFEYPFGCVIGTCPRGLQVPANASADLSTLIAAPTGAPGLLVYVERPQNISFAFNLRSRDISRQLLTWGTELPVIRESQALTGETQLLSVPLDDRFRCLLRVYDLDATPESLVQVRVHPADSELVLAEFDLKLMPPFSENVAPPFHPGYASFGSFHQIKGIGGTETVRIVIRPLTGGLRYWAFVSVTNNETQHVTSITPQ